jgi:hypothetical protein
MFEVSTEICLINLFLPVSDNYKPSLDDELQIELHHIPNSG